MNQVIEVIHNRKSVRAYEDKPLPEDVRDMILKSAMRAPTAGNMMLYSIIEVSDQKAKNKLVETCDNQPFIAEAPLVLIFLADYQRWVDYFKVTGVEQLCVEKGVPMVMPEEGDLFLACCDALIAAQTAVIAAESMGVGSCYIGDILENYEVHREMFDLPQYAFRSAWFASVTLHLSRESGSGRTDSARSSLFSRISTGILGKMNSKRCTRARTNE